MDEEVFHRQRPSLPDRLIGIVALLPVALWHIGRALFGIAIGLLVVLLLLHGS